MFATVYRYRITVAQCLFTDRKILYYVSADVVQYNIEIANSERQSGATLVSADSERRARPVWAQGRCLNYLTFEIKFRA